MKYTVEEISVLAEEIITQTKSSEAINILVGDPLIGDNGYDISQVKKAIEATLGSLIISLLIAEVLLDDSENYE